MQFTTCRYVHVHVHNLITLLCVLFLTVLELEVSLATEQEEKKLLQVRLEETREQARLQQDQLKSELEKVGSSQYSHLRLSEFLNFVLVVTFAFILYLL